MGGGTGTVTVLSGLRKISGLTLSAIVSSADDGGSTGRLRDAYGILPPGDARQALVALAEEGTILRALFNYRFTKGDIAGHNFGNLFITALSSLRGSDTEALKEAARILHIKGQVLPVSDTPSRLRARLSDGTVLAGEHSIDQRKRKRAPIKMLELETSTKLSSAARDAICSADRIIFGPGDLYTSTIATLLPSGVSAAIKKSDATLVYIVNLFTKAGQTDAYGAKKHIEEVERYAGRPIDTVIVNSAPLSKDACTRYAREGEYPVEDDTGNDSRVVRRPIISLSLVEPVAEDPVPRSLLRHDSDALARVIISL